MKLDYFIDIHFYYIVILESEYHLKIEEEKKL